ncbi:hypothetical protein HMPREF0766_10077 [Sphingobacterium spiritivorum ATCC 33861]|uniref:Uncharacterized protein n=1 Tax=Sphingobacterium spiritivorum ATCC 33861 TaxID=525373 RepID=D7VGF8_SPHSI|nr:hypothetical protein HMPREF0766_10077 [Sphingobacterium spiritivorum ATCC 33861]
MNFFFPISANGWLIFPKEKGKKESTLIRGGGIDKASLYRKNTI